MNSLLSLDECFALDLKRANELYDAHLNRYLLQVFKILGLDQLDIVGAQGAEIWLKDGTKLLDFSAGMGVVGVGHNHPRIIEAERRCHQELLIDSIRVAPHKLQGALAYNISQLLPEPLNVSYLSVSGSEAVEAALKICERAQGPKKSKFICMQRAFHGKTHGALSVTTTGRFQDGFLMGIPKENVIVVPPGDIDAIDAAIAANSSNGSNEIIAVIVEPIGGESALVPPKGYLTDVSELCRSENVLTIFDEIKVGMGRTGKFCAFQHEDVVPDVVTIAKTLGGGKRAIGAMVTSQALFDRAYGRRQDSTLHTSGFGGMGESCAVAIETLNVLIDEGLIERAAEYGSYFCEKLVSLQRKHPKKILEVRGMGLFRAIRLNFKEDLIGKVMDTSSNSLFKSYQTTLMAAIVRELCERYRILAHFQPGALDVLHFMPPMIVQKHQIDSVVGALDEILSRGLARSTIEFIAKNAKQVFSPQ